MTHTPGPWGYEVSVGCDQTDWEIAPVVDIDKGDWSREVAMTASGNEADARLIAAAPDLLATCKQLVNSLNQDLSHEQCEAWDAVIVAIAKAEGQS